MTNRQTFQDDGMKRRMPAVSRFGRFNGYDSSRIPAGCCPAAEGGNRFREMGDTCKAAEKLVVKIKGEILHLPSGTARGFRCRRKQNSAGEARAPYYEPAAQSAGFSCDAYAVSDGIPNRLNRTVFNTVALISGLMARTRELVQGYTI